MNKELKKKLITAHEEARAAFPCLYDHKWVEKAADKGWKDVVDSLEKSTPGFKKAMTERVTNIFAVVYYTAFEKALNTFFAQCLEDTVTTCKLCTDELKKVTAEINTKEK